MKKILLVLSLAFTLERIAAQGCTVTGSVPRDTIVCGDNVLLTAFGQGQGIALLSENFNTGSYGSGWSSSQQAMWNNPCSPNGVDGTTHIWMGNSSPVPRILTTNSFNLSNCVNAGVTICFDMLFAEQGNSAPCEGPDEPLEGVYLQYSIDNGATWTTIQYFDPNGGNDPQFVTWNNWCFPVPAVALTANTRFRWYQDADSGADYDHWGIDNVVIYCNDPTYNIVWQHDGYSAGPVGGVNPTPVAPRTTTSYIVVMSNGTVTCRDTVTIVVRNPTVIVNAGNDTTVCTGQCALLNATGKVLVSPAKVVTYENNEVTPITTGLGQVSNIGINVTGLNMTSILPNSITQVCIDNVFFFGTSIFPPAQIDISDLILTLVCPNGTSIILVPANVTTGGSNPLSGGYTNTCFVPGGPNITTGTSPYTGNFAPNQPFNNLVGCTPNGVWTLNVTMNTTLGFGSGTFSGWSITFDDPEISYQGNFTWSPTTNMSNSTTLTPTVCPPPSAYTLTVSDTANCVTQSDVVNVNVQACCGMSATASTVQPACAGSNGSINLTPSPAGTYSFAWNDGVTTEDRANLPAGNYCVTITDTNTPTCTFDTCIALSSNSSLSVAFSNPVNPTCAGNDGSITVTLAGGTAPYNVVVDTGGAPITFPPIPFPITQAVPGLPAGTVNVTVTDAQGCVATATATLTAPTNCCTFTVSAAITPPGCAVSNGSIALTPANGSGNYSYNWSGGLGTGSSVSGLGVGTYSVTITDNGFANCFIDTSFTLNSNSTLAVTLTNPVNPTCAGSDGSITFGLTGGTAPYVLNGDTNGTAFTANIPFAVPPFQIPNVPAGAVNVTVTDAQGCQATASATLTAPTNCCVFTVSAVTTAPTCGQADGDITLTPANGSGNYSYSWGGGLGTANTVSAVGVGNYFVTITDNGWPNCFIDTTFTLSNPNGPVIDSFKILNVTCAGNGSDGSVTVYASSVNGVDVTTGYTWSNTTLDTDDTQADLAVGTYLFTVTDLAGCSTPGSVDIALEAGCCFLVTTATVVPPTCGLNNATITVNIDTAGTPPYTYSINGTNFQVSNSFSNVAPGTYDVITLDVNLCSDTFNVVVPPSTNSLLVTVTPTNITCFGANDGIADAIVTGGTTPYAHVWGGSQTTPSLTGLSAGTYSVTVTDVSGCSGSASAAITEPSAISVNIGNDITVCEGQTVTLDAGSGFATYLWSTLETTQTITPLVTANYSVTVADLNGCTASDVATITIVPTPTVDLGVDLTLYEGQRVALYANINPSSAAGGTFNWQPDTLLSCADCQSPVAYAYDTISYTVFYTDPFGCTAQDDITLFVLPVGDIFWPNAFSPNGDGNNDFFLPFGSGVRQIEWQMFNRWGEKVFESNNFNYGCNGTYKGQPLPMGVYVYQAEATMMNSEKRVFKGSVTLIR